MPIHGEQTILDGVKLLLASTSVKVRECLLNSLSVSQYLEITASAKYSVCREYVPSKYDVLMQLPLHDYSSPLDQFLERSPIARKKWQSLISHAIPSEPASPLCHHIVLLFGCESSAHLALSGRYGSRA